MDDKRLIKQIDELIKKRILNVATKDDLRVLATKTDLKNTESRVTKVVMREVGDLSEHITSIFNKLDEKADKAHAASLKVQN